MSFHYTSEKNVQIVLALLKANGINQIIVSPGATNESVVASMQYDPYFKMYSCVDERSAAYMACGLAAETNKPVVLSCTGATSSRNYLPGLTEAYYRHLPILAITSSMDINKVGHLYPQCTDRSTPPSDTVISSECIETIKDDDDYWDCVLKVNRAISDLSFMGGGPVHLNLITRGWSSYILSELPEVQMIKRISQNDTFPSLSEKKILVFVGSHRKFDFEEEDSINRFCEKFNTVVLCDQTSNYKGKYRFLSALLASQENNPCKKHFECDVLIHIGDISGDYYTMEAISPKEVWRIDMDGKFKDKFKKLTHVFVVPEIEFFRYYNEQQEFDNSLSNPLTEFINTTDVLLKKMPSLPFSNIWLASQLSKKLPNNSILHLGILNSLRAWNFFEVDKSILSYCNVGGFGIDGIVSSMIGASLSNSNQLYFAILGDLAFFYDINSLGNRNIKNNIRILVVNNGRGVEFHTYRHPASKFGDDTDKYIAAAGHNGKQSPTLVRNIARSLGFTYMHALTKNDFLARLDDFVSTNVQQAIIFEVFTEKIYDADVLRLIRTINGTENNLKKKIKNKIKGFLLKN